MLKKIKNFFQSIAEKISFVWNSIKNLWSSKPQKNSVIELVRGKSNHLGVIKENGSKQLVLHISNKNMSEVMDWKNINCNDSSEYHINAKSDKATLKIACGKLVAMSDNSASFIVDSVDDET
ncbi:hypothetical protein IYZ83_001040 [Wolbachia pipientis]|uniref:hypothetical protein n=1 Tax=Wolbachia pipientis TaxID=955 RepID=UPI001BDB33F3|nr:hypothetical protein [Wolbachia pipientis]UIP91837.1 hypothetical protein IYZ83_001040 [Wolbachia pipientis]